MNTLQNYIDINRESWNKRTLTHFNSDFYNVQSFLKGKNSLNNIELDLLGNIQGKKILHLQCHFGMDTISLSRLGARVTGVDLSEEAILKAQQLSKQMHTDTQFICCNIFDLPKHLNDTFDIVFTSYGVINWYPDLTEWGKLVARYLKPHGKFVMVEFHPVLWMFDTNFEKIEAPYNREEPYVSVSETYTDSATKEQYTEVTWNHGLGKVFNGLLESQLMITGFEEYDYSPVNLFGNMVEDDGKYRFKTPEQLIPILFSITAEKK